MKSKILNKKELIVKSNQILLWVLLLAFSCTLIWVVFEPFTTDKVRIFERNFWVAIFMVLLFCFSIGFCIKKIVSNKPSIIISDKGIWTVKTGLIDWKNISSYATSHSPSDTLTTSSFTFTYSDDFRTVTINTTFLYPSNPLIVEFIKAKSTNSDLKYHGNKETK